MSMHLVGPYMTTTKYNSKKKTSNNKRLQAAQAEHEAWLESMGVGKRQLEEKLYDRYGKRKSVNNIPDYNTGPRVTSDKVAGHGAAKERIQYTGDEIAGIVVTHKSNLMPVRKDNKQAAIDAATMRRN
jgi:hypothetical protein